MMTDVSVLVTDLTHRKKLRRLHVDRTKPYVLRNEGEVAPEEAREDSTAWEPGQSPQMPSSGDGERPLDLSAVDAGRESTP
jgi:hypothetical protein